MDDDDDESSPPPSVPEDWVEGEPMVPNALPLPPPRNAFAAAAAVAGHLWNAKPNPAPAPPPLAPILSVAAAAAAEEQEQAEQGAEARKERGLRPSRHAGGGGWSRSGQRSSPHAGLVAPSPSPFTMSIKRKLACA